jgi:hypothetical protein
MMALQERERQLTLCNEPYDVAMEKLQQHFSPDQQPHSRKSHQGGHEQKGSRTRNRVRGQFVPGARTAHHARTGKPVHQSASGGKRQVSHRPVWLLLQGAPGKRRGRFNPLFAVLTT